VSKPVRDQSYTWIFDTVKCDIKIATVTLGFSGLVEALKFGNCWF